VIPSIPATGLGRIDAIVRPRDIAQTGSGCPLGLAQTEESRRPRLPTALAPMQTSSSASRVRPATDSCASRQADSARAAAHRPASFGSSAGQPGLNWREANPVTGRPALARGMEA